MAADLVEQDEQLLRIVLLIAYDGSTYSGFAIQNDVSTVSGELRKALLTIDPEVGTITGSSRTDSGVHARNQPVSFTTKKSVKSRGWVLALNQQLPRDIRVSYAARASLDFDPRIAPLFKRYCYRLFNAQAEDPFVSRTSWRVGQTLDLTKMREEAQHLLGEHDFRAFRSSDDIRSNTVRNIHAIELFRDTIDPRQISITVTGNRFMYNMVRIIVGTLVDVGRGRLAQQSTLLALESGQRTDLGMTAPARGLMLEHVELPDWGQDGWPAR